MSEIKLIFGNCLEKFKDIADESVDLVFADPPYNISQKTKFRRDSRSGKNMDISLDFGNWDYNFNPEPFLIESKRVLNKYGSVIVWTSEELYGIYRSWFAKNMYPKQLLLWVKDNPVPQFRLVGYRNATELMFWALKYKNTKDNPNFIFLTQREMTNVFHAPIVGGHERTKHPTQKPLKIALEIIRRHCKEGGLVCDPFFGSGTIAIACKLLNRNFIGFEIDEKYYNIAKERLEKTEIQNELNI